MGNDGDKKWYALPILMNYKLFDAFRSSQPVSPTVPPRMQQNISEEPKRGFRQVISDFTQKLFPREVPSVPVLIPI